MTFPGSILDLTLPEPVASHSVFGLLRPPPSCSWFPAFSAPFSVSQPPPFLTVSPAQEHTQAGPTHHLCSEVHLCLAGRQGRRGRVAQEHGLLGKARGCGGIDTLRPVDELGCRRGCCQIELLGKTCALGNGRPGVNGVPSISCLPLLFYGLCCIPENPVSAWQSFHGLWEHAHTTEETWS